MKKEKKIALITLLVMILNMFSPYSILFNNISKAATGVLGENPIIINNLGVTKKGSNKILTVEIAAVTEAILNGFDFQFKIDKSKITPCNKNTGASTTSLKWLFPRNTTSKKLWQKLKHIPFLSNRAIRRNRHSRQWIHTRSSRRWCNRCKRKRLFSILSNTKTIIQTRQFSRRSKFTIRPIFTSTIRIKSKLHKWIRSKNK
mgnify:CR=1 FL=1